MIKKYIEEKTVLVEILSAISLFALGMVLTKANLSQKFDIHLYFWAISLTIVSAIQFASVKLDIVVWRIVIAWISGIIWTWFAITSTINMIYIPAITIGSLNIYTSIILSNNIHFNWLDFTKD